MKRKQKMPRRTRRQIPLKPVDYEEEASITGNGKEKQNNTEIDTALSTNYCDNSAKKPWETACKKTIIVESKVSVQAENSFSNNLKPNGKKPKEKAEINLAGSTKVPTEPVRQDSINSRMLERNSDWSQGRFLKNAANSFTTFVNFSDETDNGNMPVILDVFTLSQEPTYIKKKRTNVMFGNNFPVTPPCSPPLSKLQHFTATRQFNSFHSEDHLTTQEKAATTSNVHNICCPSMGNVQKNVIHGAHIFPAEMKEFIHQESYTPERQITKFYNANEGANTKGSELGVVPGFKDNTVFSGNQPPPIRKLNTQPLKNAPVIELTHTTSYSTAKCVSESEYGLTPREMKVLQLKRRLQEQEAALKKLRASH